MARRSRSQDPPAQPRSRRNVLLAILAAAITFAAVYGTWQQQRAEQEAGTSPQAPGGLFLETQARGTALTAAGGTTGLSEPCTAWLLDTGGAPGDDAFAVTAGRCVGIEDGATVISAEPPGGVATLDLNDFARVTSSAPVTVVTVPIEEVTWASRRWTDLAILRLGTTYGALAQQGIDPIPAVAPPVEGEELLVASVPVEGVPNDQRHLRGSRCATGLTTSVAEAGLLWRDSRATDCEGILEGSFGAPVLNPAGEAVAMVIASTIAAPDGADCAAGRPCEVRDGAVQGVAPDTTYVQAVQGLERCFAEGVLRLGDGCPLEDPSTVVRARPEVASAAPGSAVRVLLDPGSPTPDAGMSSASGPLGSVDCADADAWSTPVPADEWSLVFDLPAEPGWTLACVGSPDQPTPMLVEAAT